MPIVAYLANKGAEYHKREILPKLVDVNLIPNVDQRQEVFVDDCVCMVSFTVSERRKIFVSTQYVFALEGDILNFDSADTIFNAFVRNGDRFVGELNGNFNLIIYDRIHHGLKVFNCINSLYNLYYSQFPGGCIFASNIHSIVRSRDARPAIDNQGLFKFFSMGYIFGDSTLVKEVQRLPPANIASYENGVLRCDAYWRPEFKDFFDLDMQGIARKFNDLMLEATQLRFSYFKDIKIFLSGGLDSRLIAAAAEKIGVKTETITYGFKGSKDLEYGLMCSKRLGYANHQYVTQPGISTVYSKLIDLMVWLSAAETSIKSMTSTKYHEFLIDHHVKYYSHGSTIGSVSSRHNQPYMFYPISDAKKILMTYDQFTHSNHSALFLLDKEFCRDQGRHARDEFIRSFEALPGRHFADRFVSWVVRNRLPRTVYNSNQINGYFFTSVHFFLDKHLMDFYFRVPLRYRLESLWQKLSCITINDKIKAVPYQMTGREISADLVSNLMIRVRAKLLRNTRFLDQTKHKDARKDTLTDLPLKEYLLDNLQTSTVLTDILNIHQAETMIEDHFSEAKDSTLPILALASIYKFGDLFIDGDCTRIPAEARSILEQIPYPKLRESV